jgi:hypothetical protein
LSDPTSAISRRNVLGDGYAADRIPNCIQSLFRRHRSLLSVAVADFILSQRELSDLCASAVKSTR